MAIDIIPSFLHHLRSYVSDVFFRIRLWYMLYGLGSILLHIFACAQVWCMVHQLVKAGNSVPSEKTDSCKKAGSCETADVFKNFRESEMSACNAAAVAGSLISTIAIASMAMPSADKIHWVARALWYLCLVAGLVAVLCATNLQVTISRNLTDAGLCSWLSEVYESNRPKERMDRMLGNKRQELEANCESKTKCEACLQDKAKCKKEPIYHVPDFSAVLLLSAPSMLIHLALTSYLIGLGVYIGWKWKDELDAGAAIGDSRDIFICFVVSVSILYPLYWLTRLANKCKHTVFKDNWCALLGAEEVGKRKEKHSCGCP